MFVLGYAIYDSGYTADSRNIICDLFEKLLFCVKTGR